MRYTEQLGRSIEPIYAAILKHPFLTGLTDGSLPREAFQFYVIRDAHYLPLRVDVLEHGLPSGTVGGLSIQLRG